MDESSPATPSQCAAMGEPSSLFSATSAAASAPDAALQIYTSPSPQLQLYDMIFSLVKPLALKAAVNLNIPDIIATHGGGERCSLSVEDIASHIAASAPCNTNMNMKAPHLEYLFRLLRYLASYNVFTETSHVGGAVEFKRYRYGLTALSKLLTAQNEYSCVPQLFAATSNVHWTGLQHLHETVMEGCPAFSKAFGMNAWDYFRTNPQENENFNRALASDTRAVMASVVKAYDDGFKNLNTVVDVAGGTGLAISMIVEAHPHIRGINLDLPHVIDISPALPGVEHVRGNMFEHIPPADAVFLKSVLHDWKDEQCVEILKTCHQATPGNGKVIIFDLIIEEEVGCVQQMRLRSDIEMMVFTDGGKERTEDEFKKIFHLAGYRRYIITKLPSSPFSIIEIFKA